MLIVVNHEIRTAPCYEDTKIDITDNVISDYLL